MDVWLLAAFGIFMLGIAILALASNYLITALVKFANVVHIPGIILGSVILSIATSIPEFSNNVLAALEGLSGLGVGNLIGASISTMTLVPGLVFLIAGKHKEKNNTHRMLLLFSLVPVILFLVLAYNGLSHIEGGIFLVLFIIYEFVMLRRGFKKTHKHILSRKLILPYIMVPLALFSIVIGAYLVVESGKSLAQQVPWMTAEIIGLTLVSIGTTVPEIFENTVAAFKGKLDIALGDIIGSTMINMLFIMGFIASIFSLPVRNYSIFVMPCAMLIISILFTFTYITIRKQTDRVLGTSLLMLFVFYIMLNFV